MIHIERLEDSHADVDVQISEPIPNIFQASEVPAFSEPRFENQRSDFKEWDDFVINTAKFCGNELEIEPNCTIICQNEGQTFSRKMLIYLEVPIKALSKEGNKTVSEETKEIFRRKFKDLIDSLGRKIQESTQRKSEDPSAQITSRPEKASDIELPNAQLANIVISLYESVTKKGSKWEGPIEIIAKPENPITIDFSEAPQTSPAGEKTEYFEGYFNKFNANTNNSCLVRKNNNNNDSELKFKFVESLRYDLLTALRDYKIVSCQFNVKYDETLEIVSATLTDFKILGDLYPPQTSLEDNGED